MRWVPQWILPTRPLLARRKRLRVVVHRFLAEHFQPRARGQAGSRLVEANVSIAADPKNLQIDAPGLADVLFIRNAILIVMARDSSVRNMNIGWAHVDVRKEMLAHKIMKALRMCRRKSQVLIQIESHDAGKIKRSLLVKLHEMLVHAHHRAARGQSKHQFRFLAHRAGDKLRRLPADLFTVALQEYQHTAPSLYLAFLLAETGWRRNRESSILPEPPDDEIVPVRAVKSQHVHDRFALRRIDDLANAQQRIAARHAQDRKSTRL